MAAAPGEGNQRWDRSLPLNDRARATLPPQRCSQLSKSFFYLLVLIFKSFVAFPPKTKGSHTRSGLLPRRDQSWCLQKGAAPSPATQSPLQSPVLLTLSKLSPAAGVGALPKVKKLGLLPRRVLSLSPRSL